MARSLLLGLGLGLGWWPMAGLMAGMAGVARITATAVAYRQYVDVP